MRLSHRLQKETIKSADSYINVHNSQSSDFGSTSHNEEACRCGEINQETRSVEKNIYYAHLVMLRIKN